jgi:hypothetical protein
MRFVALGYGAEADTYMAMLLDETVDGRLGPVSGDRNVRSLPGEQLGRQLDAEMKTKVTCAGR